MNNTALGAENKKKQTINFISEAHEKFYYEKLKDVRYQDVYHKALCYCLGIDCMKNTTTKIANAFVLSDKYISGQVNREACHSRFSYILLAGNFFHIVVNILDHFILRS